MKSEKVKEIKKALEHCAIHDCSDSCIFSEKHPFACLTEMHKQLLTLINELESENERLRNKKWDCQDAFDNYHEENEQLKSQIAELEKENDSLKKQLIAIDTLDETNFEKRHNAIVFITEKQLKQFAEMLKKKLQCVLDGHPEEKGTSSFYAISEYDLDETLEEVLKNG